MKKVLFVYVSIVRLLSCTTGDMLSTFIWYELQHPRRYASIYISFFNQLHFFLAGISLLFISHIYVYRLEITDKDLQSRGKGFFATNSDLKNSLEERFRIFHDLLMKIILSQNSGNYTKTIESRTKSIGNISKSYGAKIIPGGERTDDDFVRSRLLKEGYTRAKIQTDLYLKTHLGIEHVKQLGKELWVAKQMHMEKDLHIIKHQNGVSTTKITKKIKFNTEVRYAFHRLSRSCWVVNFTNPTEESFNCGVSSTMGIYLYEYSYLFSDMNICVYDYDSQTPMVTTACIMIFLFLILTICVYLYRCTSGDSVFFERYRYHL